MLSTTLNRLALLALFALLAAAACGTSVVGPTADAGPDAGGDDAGPDAGPDGGLPPDSGSPIDLPASVLQHHQHASRDGFILDPALTRAKAQALTRDAAFDGTVDGKVYAQPLYVARPAASAGGKPDLIIVATENNQVVALNAVTGLPIWQRGPDTLGAPVLASTLPCGNIAPTVGITGTPIVDVASRTIFFDALTTPDQGATWHHLVHGLSIDDGTPRAGYPVDLQEKLASRGFSSRVQGERGALAITSGMLWVPFGGLYGDCGEYSGWLVGLPLADPQSVSAWKTRARGGGIWAPGGVSSDGTSVYLSTGNTFGASTWSDGEGVFSFRSSALSPVSSFAPSDWKTLDDADLDLGGVAPVPVHVAGASPADVVLALGKDGKAYLLAANNLGGIGGQLSATRVSSGEIIGAPAVYLAPGGTTVAFAGAGIGGAGCPGSLAVLRLTAATPPSAQVAFCANAHGRGAPLATTSSATETPILWVVGAEGDNRLHGFDGDTGAVVFAGGGAAEAMTTVQHFQTPIAARGRMFVAANGKVFAFH